MIGASTNAVLPVFPTTGVSVELRLPHPPSDFRRLYTTTRIQNHRGLLIPDSKAFSTSMLPTTSKFSAVAGIGG